VFADEFPLFSLVINPYHDQATEEYLKLLSLLPFAHNVAICGSCALWFYAAELDNGAIPNWMPCDCDLCAFCFDVSLLFIDYFAQS
jgi:hypothetical protein